MTRKVKLSIVAAGAVLVLLLVGNFIYARIQRWRLLRSLDEERVYSIPARRGDIFDTDGNLIATSKIAYDIHLDCAMIDNQEEWRDKTLELAPKLSLLFPERNAAEWWQYLQNGKEKGKRYLSIAKGVDYRTKDSLASFPIFNMGKFKGGAIYDSYYAREYPYDSLARRVIGYTRPGLNSRVGIEGSMDCFLSGTEGKRTVRYGWVKGQRRNLETKMTPPQPGMDVKLSLSINMQALADSALRANIGNDYDIQSGCVVLMEVKTGAIRAMVNLSRGTASYETERLWERYNDAIAHHYEPGEVIQTMTLASVLRDRFVESIDENIPTCHGVLEYYPQDIHLLDYERSSRSNKISIREGFAISSRYTAGHLATTYYSDAAKYFAEGIRGFCYPEKANFDVEGFRPVDITNPEGYYWQNSSLPSLANGYCLTMTPLDILSFYNTIANHGQMVRPYLVQAIGPDAALNKTHNTTLLKKDVLSAAVADTLKQALGYVVTEGTAQLLKNTKFPIAGKTGTAFQILNPNNENRLPDDPYHDIAGRKKTAATFVGFFPADNPQYSIICVLFSKPCAQTYYGGRLPAQVVRDIVNALNIETE